MLAVKCLVPDKGSMRALQLPLTFRAATVAVAVDVPRSDRCSCLQLRAATVAVAVVFEVAVAVKSR
jgi:hypothetical protein